MKLIGIDCVKEQRILKLLKRIGAVFSDEYEIIFNPGDKLRVEKNGCSLKVEYKDDSQLFRSLLLSAQLVSENKDGEITQEPQFEKAGIMLDMSRAGVMKVERVKEYLEYMALCGLNVLYLYMEDVYEVEGLPYFGYMRGRYSKDDLKEIDDYASSLGIEAIPCIQTLGHFEQYIKWSEGKRLSDTPTVVMPENEEVYEFIDKLISTVSGSFKTKRIHIGMDEAWGMGTGNYLKQKGYRDGTEIFCEHIRRVKEITDKYGLEPMIWSDMYFRLSSETGDYYDENAVVPDYVKELLPENMGITYWDYYHTDESYFRHMFSEHKKITDKVGFVGGIWLWAGLLPDYEHTVKSTSAALNVCKEQNIKEIFASTWGDDGCETDGMFSLPGCVLYGEHSYNREIDIKELNKKLKILFNAELSDFTDISKALYPKGEFTLERNALAIKQIVYNDILCGLADYDTGDEKLISHYEGLYEKYNKLSEKEGYFKEHFKYVAALCRLAADKTELTIKLHSGYKKNEKLLYEVKDKLLNRLEYDYKEVKGIHYRLWHNTYRPFGFEIVDGRYGMKLERIITAALRLEEYLNGETDSLPELSEQRLPFINEHSLSTWHSGISSSFFIKGY